MLKVIHIVNSVFTSRTYILSNDENKEFWLVDCGDVPPLTELLAEQGGNLSMVKGVLLTHAHYDHIYGLPRLAEQVPSVKIYTNEIGKRALTNPRLNMSKYHDDPIVFESGNVVVTGEGSLIELFEGVTAKVYETPGHHPSCLTFDVGDFLFTGDAYIPGVKVVTMLAGADKAVAPKSVERILKLAEGKVICPGHEVALNY